MFANVNNTVARPGSIYRIALTNFLTYKEVELYPGPSLNMIIGPNGTGKSTFVCAIILGLCGTTTNIGRAKNISDYVRTGCEEATIEIELHQGKSKGKVIVTRRINSKNKSFWYLDQRVVKEIKVKELMNDLNIQVDNLCQLLPQDRVQHFAKMNPRELLRSTLSAIGDQEKVRQLDDLIQCREKQRNATTNEETNVQAIKNLERQNERSKDIIDKMDKKKKAEKLIQICRKKMLWIEYEVLRVEHKEYKEDKQKASKVLNKINDYVEPLKDTMQKANVKISVLEKQRLSASQESRILQDTIKKILNSFTAQEVIIKGIEDTFQQDLERHRKREDKLIEAKRKLEKLVVDKANLEKKFGGASSVNELNKINQTLTATMAAINQLERKKLQDQLELDHEIMPAIRLCENKIRNLENVNIGRLKTLRKYSEDHYQAVMWLRKNKDKFKHPVYEPMMLEITFRDPTFSRYLESTVPVRDLIAFTFEDRDDMNNFIKLMRTQGWKKVTAVCSPGGRFNIQTPNISRISYLGFTTYLVNTIIAPDPIIRYLCNLFGIHRIPIGTDHTYQNSETVIENHDIRFFFTENHRFSIRKSAYSGLKSVSSIEIRQARLLADTVDINQLETFNNELSNFQQSEELKKKDIEVYDKKLQELKVQLDHFSTMKKNICDSLKRIEQIDVEIRLQKGNVDVIKNESFDISRERDRCRKKKRDSVMKQCQLHEQLYKVMKTLHGQMQNKDLLKVKLDITRNSIVKQESEFRKLQNELRTAQETLKKIKTNMQKVQFDATKKFSEAMISCDNIKPDDRDFPYKLEFEALPSDSNSLKEHYYDLQTQIECTIDGDDRVIKDYEERVKEISELRRKVDQTSANNKKLEETMNQIKSKWLPPLHELVMTINNKFSDMFKDVGCAGRIDLQKGSCDDDYDKYGIAILVSFRRSEPLQPLTSHAQSGGERGLSTALYLLALQAAAPAPFRCVDEINQGMDPVNERKMLKLLINVTTERNNAQYFLLTPKLLPNLEYNEKVMMHTVMNGKSIVNYRHWNIDKFLERAESQRM